MWQPCELLYTCYLQFTCYYGSIGGSRVRSPPVPVVLSVYLCSTALQCICRVIRRSSMTMKAHTYYIIFGRPPIGGSFPPSSLAAPPRGVVAYIPQLLGMRTFTASASIVADKSICPTIELTASIANSVNSGLQCLSVRLHVCLSSCLFTARCYVSAVLTMGLCLSVCLSVCVCHKSEFY